MGVSRSMRHDSFKLTIAAVLIAICGLSVAARGQESTSDDRKAAKVDPQDAERQKIFESDEWRQLSRTFDEWLTVQQIYTPEEIATISADLQHRVATMSPRELREFQHDMMDRLHVLLSPEAAEARHWLEQFVARTVNPEQQLGRNRPDVLNMNASQIRQEILWLEQQRGKRLQAQAAFERGRALQSQSALDARAAQQASNQNAINRSSWPANTPRTRSPYAPRREREPSRESPVYMIGPWGTYFRL